MVASSGTLLFPTSILTQATWRTLTAGLFLPVTYSLSLSRKLGIAFFHLRTFSDTVPKRSRVMFRFSN
ncbi:hypothetical protein AUF78_06775 [archaeon 13_1_20CM_2_51_12]|nr:MAG: hypothetical protein AUF78_06775 [archaeon 13_1_20CM_2_51_12]